MLKDLENARQAIQNKLTDKPTNSNLNTQEFVESDVDTVDFLQSCEDDLSDLDDFIIIKSKRSRKTPKRLSLSGRKPVKTKNKENPCFNRGRRGSGIQAPSKPQYIKKSHP